MEQNKGVLLLRFRAVSVVERCVGALVVAGGGLGGGVARAAVLLPAATTVTRRARVAVQDGLGAGLGEGVLGDGLGVALAEVDGKLELLPHLGRQ